jgi:hypothetical protein
VSLLSPSRGAVDFARLANYHPRNVSIVLTPRRRSENDEMNVRTSNVTGRRKLRFNSLDEVTADAE